MALRIDRRLTPQKLVPRIERLLDLSARKIASLEKSWNPDHGAPVFTVRGRYTARGWTEWTQGFQFGSAILQYDATGEERFLDSGRRDTIQRMAAHVSHTGVHDHGFNNLSTYGNLLRLMREGRIPCNERERDFYQLALKVSGAVQAARWTRIADGTGFIHSFNGPHSLFIDTLRSLRSLGAAHQLGHVLRGERDAKISLLQRLVEHAFNTARFNIYYGRNRDAYDRRGRVAHECLFNATDGSYRCPNSQQGWSPFSTWSRGLAWAILGFAEQLEFLDVLGRIEFESLRDTAVSEGLEAETSVLSGQRRGRELRLGARVELMMVEAATATASRYLATSCANGIPMWDDEAPQLHRLKNYRERAADPFNSWEPVDSSAAAIAAQGLIRLGNFLNADSSARAGDELRQAGFTIAGTLFDEPYLSTDLKHQGLILHSVYHRPNGWDHVAPGQKVPNGESSMWGDYHARELALLLLREARNEPYPTFFEQRERKTPSGTQRH